MTQLIESWINSANDPNGNFPLNNLPFGIFSTESVSPRCASRLGDKIIDLACLEQLGFLDMQQTLSEVKLNPLMALGPEAWHQLRSQLTQLLGKDCDTGTQKKIAENALHDLSDCTLHLPFRVSEYTDFYAGRHHATNVGTMLRGPENALSANWLHMPIGYNGRASTVVVSGTPITRPCGQLKSPQFETPIFAPSRRLDIELEMGAVVGSGSEMGRRLSVAQADEVIFGYVLLNDWSARDIQAWEYQPLGPFQAKAFATSISPWVITKAALEPFRVDSPEREKPLLDYLHEPGPMLYDIQLEIGMIPNGSNAETTISQTNYREMYYSSAQQLAHHASSGCAMTLGDLLGSGTISGPDPSSFGSLLELSWGGKTPLTLDSGEQRSFIEDGDTLVLRGYSQGEGYRIGFGECRGTSLPAVV